MKRDFLTHPLCCILLFGFLLGVHNGRIALWKDEDPEPFRVFPCPVCVLPPEDQEALMKGIHLDDMEDVNHFLENFLS